MDSTFDNYEFSRACEALYHFAWDEFCDWYLELAKVQLADGITHTTAVLAAVLDTLLKLLHPVMPFVTEALWKALTGGESLVIAEWPTPSGFAVDRLRHNGSPICRSWSPRCGGSAATRGWPIGRRCLHG